MKLRIVKWVVPVLLVLALVSQPLLGQVTGRGEVRGVVQDPNQAVIPGADVTLTNTGTNVTRTTITSEVGAYFIGGVPVGPYALKVEMPGFNTWTTALSVQAGSTVTINAELQIGDISTSIEVMDTASEVSIDRLEIADVKDFGRIQQLPLNGRSVTSLFSLTPGVEGGGSPRVLGMKVGSVEMTFDGVSTVDRFGGGMARVQPGLDTIEEFRIETVGSDARFSRPATVTLVSRSGSNEVHGSVFWTHRNNAGILRAWNRAEQEGRLAKEAAGEDAKKSKLIRNEFGVTVGGPLWLGNLYDGRDKTFWFFSYEGLRSRQSRFNGRWPQVPMAGWWDGDFSELIDGNENPITIYNPFTTQADGTRDVFPGNQVPSSLFHPFAETLEALTPKPNIANRNPALANNFEFFYPQNTDTNLFTWKVDQVLSEKDNLSVRWTHSTRFSQLQGGQFGNPPPDNPSLGGYGSQKSDAVVENISVNWNRAFSPSILNELLVGVMRPWKESGTLGDDYNWADEFGLPNPFNENSAPGLWADCPAGCDWDRDNIKAEPQTHVSVENNVTWVKGDHVLQFGGKAKIEHNNVRELQYAFGSHGFRDDWTALYDEPNDNQVSFTGNGLAAALMGLGTDFGVRYNRGYFYFRQNEFGLFVNDKWKVNPRLTVNFGVRWDAWTPYREKYDRLAAIDPDTFYDPIFQVVTPNDTLPTDIAGIPSGVLGTWANRGLSWVTANSVGFPSNLFQPDWNNLGPRLGLSYMLTDKTVIRGSYGEYFWTLPLAQILQISRTQPPFDQWFETEVRQQPGNADDTGDRFIYAYMNQPKPADFLDQIEIDVEGIVELPATARSGVMLDGRNWREAHARSWHVTLEHEVMRNSALRLSYTGNHAGSLEQRQIINNPESEFNYVSRTGETYPSGTARDQLRYNPDWSAPAINKTGFSNTHSGQVEFERRYSDGIGLQAFYVYSRSLTSTDGGGFTSSMGSLNSGGGGQIPDIHQLYQHPNPVGPHFTSDPGFDFRRRLVYGNSSNIPPHRVRFNGIVDLPFGRGKRIGSDVSGAVNQVIGGWQVAFIGDWRSGFYRTINTGRGVFGDYTISPGDRPEVEIFGENQILWFAGDVSPSSCDGGDCAAMASFIPEDRSRRAIRPYGVDLDNRVPVALNDGTTRDTNVLSGMYWPFAKNNWMGTRSWNMDLSIFKHFYFTEDIKLRATADFFNFFNHPTDSNPSSTSGLVNLGTQANSPRTIQLSLRVDF